MFWRISCHRKHLNSLVKVTTLTFLQFEHVGCLWVSLCQSPVCSQVHFDLSSAPLLSQLPFCIYAFSGKRNYPFVLLLSIFSKTECVLQYLYVPIKIQQCISGSRLVFPSLFYPKCIIFDICGFHDDGSTNL